MLGKKLIQAAAKKPSGGGGGGDHYVALGSSGTPYIHVYDFNSTTGFGGKYSNPATTPSKAVYGISWKPDASALVYAAGAGEYGGYLWSSSGFGTKKTNATTNHGSLDSNSINFNPTGTYVTVTGYAGSPAYSQQAAIPWSNTTGYGTAVYPSSGANGWSGEASWHPSGSYIGVVNQGGGTYVYPWTGSAWGTATAMSPQVGGSVLNRIRFSPDGNSIVTGIADTSPYIVGYEWSSGFGTKYADPGTNPGSRQTGLAFTSNSNTLFVTTLNSPYIHAYPFTTGASGGFGSKYSNPSTLPPSQSRQVDVTSDDKAIVLSTTNSPYIVAYKWTGTGFGAKISDPSTLANSGRSCSLVTVP